MRKHPPILFLDTETLGFNGPVWEIGMLLAYQPPHNVYGRHTLQRTGSFLVRHHFVQSEFDAMPESFRDDYRARYDSEVAFTVDEAIGLIAGMVNQVDSAQRAEIKVAGSNPGYDLRHLEKMTGGHDFGWHYSPLDVPTLAAGWLFGRGVPLTPPYQSEFISRVCGVDPRDFARHTALGDCRWMHALWRTVAA